MTPIVDRYGRSFADPKAVKTGELAVAVSQSLRTAQQLWYENDIVREKGISFLRKMAERNDVISSAMQTRRRRLLLRGWDVLPASDDPKDIRARDIVKAMLEGMDGSFKDDIGELCDAISFGFSLLEMVWEPWESEWGRFWRFRTLKALLQENYRIVGDAHANVVEFVQTSPVTQVIPREKVVYAKYRGRPGDPYGQGVFADLYWCDFFLSNVTRFWLVAAERFGTPLITVTHPRSANPTTRQEAVDLVEALASSTGIAMSEDIKVALVEASQAGRMTYEEFTARFERRTRIAIIGQSMTSEAPKTGTQALGTVQEHELDNIIEDDREWVETVVNEEIIQPWCAVNLADLRDLPRFAIKPGKPDPDTVLAQAEKLVKLGVPVGRSYVQEQVGFPEPGKDEELLVAEPDRNVGPTGDWQFGEPDRNVGPTRAGQFGEPDGNVGPTRVGKFGEPDRFVDESSWVAFADDVDGAWWRAFSEYETPRIMRSIERVSRSLFDGVRDEARDVWKVVRDQLVKQVEKSGALDAESSTYGEMPDLGAQMKPWRDLVTRVWLTAHLDGRLSAVDELSLTSFAEGSPTGMSGPQGDGSPAGMSGPQGDKVRRFAEELRTDAPSLDDAKAWFVGRVSMTDAEFARIAREARRNAFYITTRENQEAVGQVYDALKQALDNGWGLPEFRRDVERRFKVWTGDVFGSAAPKTVAQADARLATVFRTNIMSALNRGRDAMFERAEDPEQASDPVVAYQYSAVMDSATRRTHAAMDGKIFAAKDPIWSRWKPPAGYNCRCVRIPILASQAAARPDSDLSTAPPVVGGVQVEPDAGFGRQAFGATASTVRFAEDVDTMYAPWFSEPSGRAA